MNDDAMANDAARVILGGKGHGHVGSGALPLLKRFDLGVNTRILGCPQPSVSSRFSVSRGGGSASNSRRDGPVLGALSVCGVTICISLSKCPISIIVYSLVGSLLNFSFK